MGGAETLVWDPRLILCSVGSGWDPGDPLQDEQGLPVLEKPSSMPFIHYSL